MSQSRFTELHRTRRLIAPLALGFLCVGVFLASSGVRAFSPQRGPVPGGPAVKVLPCSLGPGNCPPAEPTRGLPPPTRSVFTGPAIGYVYINAEGSVRAFQVDAGAGMSEIAGSPFATVPGAGSNCNIMTAVYARTKRILYVSNSGQNSVSAFSVNMATGALTPVPGSPFALSAPAPGAAEAPAGLAVDATENYLYAGKGYNPFPGGPTGVGNYGLDGFRIAANGALSLLAGSPFTDGGFDSGFVVANDPVNNTIITGVNGATLKVMNINPTTGALTFNSGISSFVNTHHVSVNPARRELVVSDPNFSTGVFLGSSINPGGAIGAPVTTQAGSLADASAITGNGNRMYGGGVIRGITGLNASVGPTLTPQPWSPFAMPSGTFPNPTWTHPVVSPDGRVLVINTGTLGNGRATSYSLDPSTGAPTQVDTLPFTKGNGSVGCGAGIVYVPIPQNVTPAFTAAATGGTSVAPSCPGYFSDFLLNATFTNIGSVAYSNVYFEVAQIGETVPPAPVPGPFRLLSATGASCSSGGLVGSQQPYIGIVNPTQSAPVQFRIAVPERRQFAFFVNVYATALSSVRPALLGQGWYQVSYDRFGQPVITAIPPKQ